MANRESYSTGDIAKIMHAQLDGHGEVKISYLLNDSRTVVYPSRSLFFAFKTAQNDGHRFIAELYGKGVQAFVVQANFDRSPFVKADFLIVDDVLVALQTLAKYHRQKFEYPVVAITGSNGKTVVKEWLFTFLHDQFKVVRSPRSYNSQIGVPLSLWQMASHHDVALIEAGISEPGEMERLQPMIHPSVGIFTNIGSAHAKNFESLEQKAMEKAELFKDCSKIVFCRDHSVVTDALLQVVNGDSSRLLSWSLRGADQAIPITKSDTHLRFNFYGQTVKLPIPFHDKASIENLLNAFFMALHLGVPILKLIKLIDKLVPVSMRLQERTGLNGNLLINDFYNSDPESMRIALDLLGQKPMDKKRVVVLSDFEGINSGDAHQAYVNVVEQINSRNIDEVVGIGKVCSTELQGVRGEPKFFPNTQAFLDSGLMHKWQNAAILLKGARRFGFEKIAEELQEKIHQTWLEVNLNAMVHNLRYYRTILQPNVKLMAMVKAFGYGAGNLEIARLLAYHKVDYLAVAYADEGIELRKGGIELPIMVMNPDQSSHRRLIEFDLEPEIYSIRQLEQFAQAIEQHFEGEKFNIHLKLETGMNRLGFTEDELEQVLAVLGRENRLHVVSVFSHLAASDMPEYDAFTQMQIERFKALANRVEIGLGYAVVKHIANTSAITRFKEAQFDMVRLGIGLYGQANSAAENKNLQMVTRWLTRISQIKEIEKGESVGYGRSYIAKEKTAIATLPVGYADGYYRALSNGVGKVSIGGVLAPVVGRVCMDMIMVDVSGMNVKVGDQVELMGEHISAHDMARSIDTIPYEILTHISSRVPRIYLTE